MRELRSATSITEVGEEEQPLTWDEATALIRVILRMDARLDEIEAMLDELLDGDDGEEEEEADA